MGWVMMSKQDLQRIEVLTEVLAGRRTTESAAAVLDMSMRQVQRLVNRYRDGGGGALIHRARGRASNYQLGAGFREYVVELVRQNYRDFGPTLASEALLERHGVEVSRETLRKWMVEAGLWLSRKQRRTFHQPRLRRESYGELVQIDGSEHRWFENRGEPCTLLVFIDDATSRLMQLRFVPSESTESYFEALRGYLDSHGCPVAFYSDKHSVFRATNPNTKGVQSMTQFGRALAELNIEILCANSSQAKGRVERVNRTLQDRLVKELRLAGISDTDNGNTFLPKFMEHFNERFAVRPAKSEDQHRKQIILEQTELAKGLAGQYVELYDFFDRPLEVRWKGKLLPYRTFRKDQRVTHTAVVENKRLGHALAIVKAQQELKLEAKVPTNSEKDGYKKRPRAIYGPDFVEKKPAPAAVEMMEIAKSGDFTRSLRTTTTALILTFLLGAVPCHFY